MTGMSRLSASTTLLLAAVAPTYRPRIGDSEDVQPCSEPKQGLAISAEPAKRGSHHFRVARIPMRGGPSRCPARSFAAGDIRVSGIFLWRFIYLSDGTALRSEDLSIREAREPDRKGSKFDGRNRIGMAFQQQIEF
jgi:hypothetical protein